MLKNVLDAAAQHDQIPHLLHLLQEQLHQWQLTYETIQATYPTLAPFSHTWQARIHQAQQRLITLLSQYSATYDESPISPA
jgi:hypothetical protein